MVIKTRLKELQKEHHINSTALADATGIHRNTITAWKLNKLNGVKFENVQAIMIYFGLDSLDQLFELVIDD